MKKYVSSISSPHYPPTKSNPPLALKLLLATEFHPPAFQQTIDPILLNSLMPRNSCLLPNHLWSYLNWVGSISTSLMAKNHPMWMDNGHPKNTKNGKFPNVEMAQNSHVCEGKNSLKTIKDLQKTLEANQADFQQK